MKKIILKSLHLENFKQFSDKKVVFNEKQTFISGDNGTGKSTIFDAFMWLLFGKDVQDRKDYEVKRLINGESVPKTEVSVTGVLEINGEIITLRRQLVERWSKDKGIAEEKFKGNKTVTTFNEVPMNVTDYDRKINEIIDSTVFKMITNPLFFANMGWEQQREQLFQIAGCLSDDEIADKDEAFKALLDSISGKSLRDYRKEIVSKINKAKEQLRDVQPRIDQENKRMPDALDFTAIEDQIQAKQNRITEIDNAIYSKHEAENLKFKDIQEKQRVANSLKQERQQLLFDANQSERDRVNNANQDRKNVATDIVSIDMKIRSIEDQIKYLNNDIKAYQDYINRETLKADDLRNQWFAENAKEYNGETDCNHCGQPLPVKMMDKAKQIFQDSKANKLNEITMKGTQINTNIAEAKEKIAKCEDQIKENQIKIDGLNDEKILLENKLSKITFVDFVEVDPQTLPEYVKLTEKISAFEENIKNFTPEAVDDSELKNQKAEIVSEIDSLKAQLHTRQIISEKKAEIKRLEKEATELSQLIADYQKIELTIKAFTKTKVDDVDSRINRLFSFVTFKLFSYTIEDNTENETCIPLVNGVPFPAANTAGQLNAGLDIINALSKHYGVIAPIFLDNRESVNKIIDTDAQIINLKVSEDKLTIKN
jgi:DNA repair exonuclease SbcCD ATPase subunit